MADMVFSLIAKSFVVRDFVQSLRLVRNPSEERFQTSWNDNDKPGFWIALDIARDQWEAVSD